MTYVIGKPPFREVTFKAKQPKKASLDLSVFINEMKIPIKRLL